MYKLKRAPGLWCLADIARFVGSDPKTVFKHMSLKNFPSSVKIGKRNYWKEEEIRCFYMRKISRNK